MSNSPVEKEQQVRTANTKMREGRRATEGERQVTGSEGFPLYFFGLAPYSPSSSSRHPLLMVPVAGESVELCQLTTNRHWKLTYLLGDQRLYTVRHLNKL